jgi:hypothetical protein
MFGNSDNNRSQDQGGPREGLSTKEGGGKDTAVGTRTGSEAAMRAMSVLGNAKSNRHRKTHRVEPDGTGRKFTPLTRGDLWRESAGEVSRGRSSEDPRVTAGRTKGRRDRARRDRRTAPPVRARRTPKQAGRDNCGRHPARRERTWRVESRLERERGVRVRLRARGGAR